MSPQFSERVKKKCGPTTALRVRSNLSSLFAYAIGMGLRDDNPVINTLKAAVPNGGKRDRVLSEEEIAAIWRNLPEDHDFGRIIKLLILTGCREDEIGYLAWGEIDGDARSISRQSGARMATPTPCICPSWRLSSFPTAAADRPLVFGNGRGGFQGYGKCKDELDAKLGFDKPWRIHDIRRECRHPHGRASASCRTSWRPR